MVKGDQATRKKRRGIELINFTSKMRTALIKPVFDNALVVLDIIGANRGIDLLV